MSNSLCKSSPSNAPPCITAVWKADDDGMSVTRRSGEKTSKGRDEVGDEGEGAIMISRRSSSIALSLIDFVIESSAVVVVAEDEGVMLSSVI
jgi:hypothetical protein